VKSAKLFKTSSEFVQKRHDKTRKRRAALTRDELTTNWVVFTFHSKRAPLIPFDLGCCTTFKRLDVTE
jgi:hypothetical protein